MKSKILLWVVAASLMCFAADGSWLKKVPPQERQRVNPYTGHAGAVSEGRSLFEEHCAKCHGDHAQGKGSRPALVSPRIAAATDGELAWLLKNGNSFRGMPIWGSLPERDRWELVAYLRSLNSPTGAVHP